VQSSKFHFQKIDWIIYFPSVGNQGRPYAKYGVAYRDRRKGVTQPGFRTNLEDVMKKPEIEKNYPHTVGYFMNSSGRGENWVPEYLKIRKVNDLNEFFSLLSELNV